MRLTQHEQRLLTLALTEDLGADYQDVTSLQLFADQHRTLTANIISKHPEKAILCGLPVINQLCDYFNCQVHAHYPDGEQFSPGAILLTLRGKPYDLLSIERICLNFLSHLSAVATITYKFIEQLEGTSCQLLDTRKTIPGFRSLEKYAVRCGGGQNHRMGLYDTIMLKDTHIDLLGGIDAALAKLSQRKSVPIIVEIRTYDELVTAINHASIKYIDRILLDNMTTNTMQRCVELVHEHGLVAEASGNVSLSTIKAVAQTGVDYVSVGALTHSAGRIDLSMQIKL